MSIYGSVPSPGQFHEAAHIIEMAMRKNDGRGTKVLAEANARGLFDGIGASGNSRIDEQPFAIFRRTMFTIASLR